jgi:hypothetical protein
MAGYKDIKPRWKKGESGNLKGRPPKLPELDKLLAQVLGEEKDGITAAEVILKAIRAKAAKGDVRASELLLDRAYGKPKQTLDTTLTTTEPLVIVTTKEQEQSNTGEA